MRRPAKIGAVEREERAIDAGEGVVQVEHLRQLRGAERSRSWIKVHVEVFARHRCKRNRGRATCHGNTICQRLCGQFAANIHARLPYISSKWIVKKDSIFAANTASQPRH